jgi:hypothetical protein
MCNIDIRMAQLETLFSPSIRVIDLSLDYMCNLLLCSYKHIHEKTMIVNQVNNITMCSLLCTESIHLAYVPMHIRATCQDMGYNATRALCKTINAALVYNW